MTRATRPRRQPGPPSRRLGVGLIVVVGLLLGIGPVARGGAQEPAPTSDPSLTADDPRLAPELVNVVVDSPAYREALGRSRDAENRLADARTRYADNQTQLGDLTAAEARLAAEVNDATRRRDKSQRRLDALRASLGELAVETYIRGGIGAPLESGLDLEAISSSRREQVLLDTIHRRQLDDVRANLQVVDQSEAVIATSGAELTDLQTRLSDTTAARDQAITDGQQAAADVERLKGELNDARLEAQVVGLGTGDGSESGIGFQLVALDAYVRAAAAINLLRPECAIRWQALAGVGRIETAHGTYLGRHLQADGKISEDVIGIALDGNNDTAVIPDSDGGAIDGDSAFDRAVGPMAFIPAAWRQYGRDGNGDGVADPQNEFDAVLASAVLLCRTGPLDTDEGLRRAFFAYNPSQTYVDLVLGFVHRYDAYTLPLPAQR